MRAITSPSAGSTIVDKLKVYEGGTSSANASAALTALNGIPYSSVSQPNGVAGLDSSGKLLVNQLPIDQFPTDAIKGPTSLVKGTTGSYFISNYDVFTDYVITASVGTVIVTGSTIMYTAPNAITTGGFTINGRSIQINITDYKPDTPTLAGSHSADGTTNARYDAVSSVFNISGVSNTHMSTDWELSLVSDFSTTVITSNSDGVNKTSWPVTGLNRNTTYYARCRYRSSSNYLSEWSNTFSFTTSSSYAITNEEAKLSANDKAASDFFGYGVSISGDGTRVAIGAHNADHSSLTNAGAVYIFLRTGTSWTQEAKLIATDPVGNVQFGVVTALDSNGTRVIIGSLASSPDAITSAGAVYVFLRTGVSWAQEAKLTASDKAANDRLGSFIDVDSTGTRVIAAAPSHDTGGTVDAGAVYIFTRTGTTWTQEQKIFAADKATSDTFGNSVSMDSTGTRVIIGAEASDPGGLNAVGSAYVWIRSGTIWTQEQKLTSTGGVVNDRFGFSVAIDDTGTRVAIGARETDPGGVSAAGSVYVFLRTGSIWTQEAVLSASDKVVNTYIGSAVAIDSTGTRIICGSLSLLANTVAAGAAYVFVRSGTTWSQEAKLFASDYAYSDNFGWNIGIDNNGIRVVISSYASDPGGLTNAGAAYIFRA